MIAEVLIMPKKIDWDKIKKMAEKGFSVKEISESIGVAKGTLYNNKSKWSPVLKKESAECITEVLERESNKLPSNNVSSEKEVLEIKEFYKKTLKSIKERISDVLSREFHDDSHLELQLLDKLVRVTKETRRLDYIIYDILTYKDLATLEIMVKKLEMEVINFSNK